MEVASSCETRERAKAEIKIHSIICLRHILVGKEGSRKKDNNTEKF